MGVVAIDLQSNLVRSFIDWDATIVNTLLIFMWKCYDCRWWSHRSQSGKFSFLTKIILWQRQHKQFTKMQTYNFTPQTSDYKLPDHKNNVASLGRNHFLFLRHENVLIVSFVVSKSSIGIRITIHLRLFTEHQGPILKLERWARYLMKFDIHFIYDNHWSEESLVKFIIRCFDTVFSFLQLYKLNGSLTITG